MKADIDLDTGTVTAEFSLAEFQEIVDALAGRNEKPARPERPPWSSTAPWELKVESDSKPGQFYQTRIWWDSRGKHGSCPCGDRTYRHNWCKHLVRSDAERRRQLAVLS